MMLWIALVLGFVPSLLGYQQEYVQSGSSQFGLGPDVNVFGLKWTDDWDTAVGNKYERDVNSGTKDQEKYKKVLVDLTSYEELRDISSEMTRRLTQDIEDLDEKGCHERLLQLFLAGMLGQIQRETNPGHRDTLYHTVKEWLVRFEAAGAGTNAEMKSGILDRQYFFMRAILDDWLFVPINGLIQKDFAEELGPVNGFLEQLTSTIESQTSTPLRTVGDLMLEVNQLVDDLKEKACHPGSPKTGFLKTVVEWAKKAKRSMKSTLDKELTTYMTTVFPIGRDVAQSLTAEVQSQFTRGPGGAASVYRCLEQLATEGSTVVLDTVKRNAKSFLEVSIETLISRGLKKYYLAKVSAMRRNLYSGPNKLLSRMSAKELKSSVEALITAQHMVTLEDSKCPDYIFSKHIIAFTRYLESTMGYMELLGDGEVLKEVLYTEMTGTSGVADVPASLMLHHLERSLKVIYLEKLEAASQELLEIHGTNQCVVATFPRHFDSCLRIYSGSSPFASTTIWSFLQNLQECLYSHFEFPDILTCNADSVWSLARASSIMKKTARSILKTSREDLKRSLSEQPNLAPAERDLLTHLPDEVFDTAITTSLSSLSFILESLSYMERKFKEGPKGYIELSAKVSAPFSEQILRQRHSLSGSNVDDHARDLTMSAVLDEAETGPPTEKKDLLEVLSERLRTALEEHGASREKIEDVIKSLALRSSTTSGSGRGRIQCRMESERPNELTPRVDRVLQGSPEESVLKVIKLPSSEVD